MKLSIVATLYCSAPYLSEFYQRISAQAKKNFSDDYEIILVNDGSPDDSLEIAKELFNDDPRVRVIDLSRNFGHHKAMLTGLEVASGEKIFLIDVDLEERPEYLEEFNDKLEATGCDVVYGIQDIRKGGWFERWTGSIAYFIFDLLIDIKHPKNIVTMRLMKRDYVNALLQFQENEVIISYLWVITGFDQRAVAIKKIKRDGTSYSFSKRLDHVINAITSFSAAPLKFIFYCGLFVFLISLFYSIYLLYQKIFLNIPIDGWTSVIISIWLLSGIMFLFIGIIGIYLMKIFSETKRRPRTIIRKEYVHK